MTKKKRDMKKIPYKLLIGALLIFQTGCEVDDKDLKLATYPTDPNVFIDSFSPGLNYAAFGGSDPKAFQVDEKVKYEGTASMHFAVPNYGSAEGAYAGGTFFVEPGRDLSGYDCLTFWAKASQPATIDIIGFGNDLGVNKYQVSISDAEVNVNWKQYYVPIPDASKLTKEKGMLFYSTGPIDGNGYAFWLDQVKFEKLGTITKIESSIMDGKDVQIETFNGQTHTVTGISATFSLPNGTTQKVNMTNDYFTFASSDQAVAIVSESGVVSIVGPGKAVISANLGDSKAKGSLVINATGSFVHAPTPTRNANEVISIFSDAYTNVPVDFYNGYWMPYQTTTSADFTVDGDNILAYNNFNFVGIQFTNPTINASQMTNLHLDIYVPTGTNAQSLKLTIKNFGNDGVEGGNDDTSFNRVLSNSQLVAGRWNSIDLSIVGENKSNLGQIVLEDGVGLTSFFMDNIYFYKDTQQSLNTPAQAAPTPTRNASKVISIFSDAFTNVPVNTFRTDWSSAILEDVLIAGNATKKYSQLDFVGIETVSPTVDATNITHFHIDVWSSDFTNFSIKLVDFGADGAFGGGDDVEHQVNFSSPAKSGWVSYDIPLSDFTNLATRAHIAQYILVAEPSSAATVFVDNIYFYNNGGGGSTPTVPTTTAPTPPKRNVADVKSIFSSAYTNVPVDTYITGWSAAKHEVITIAGKQVLKYYDLDYVGIEAQNPRVDISNMTHLHVDIWSPNFSNFLIKLVDFGVSGSAELSNGVVNYQAPIQSQWISYDIPLSEFVGLNQSGRLAQFLFSGTPTNSMVLYVDNFYFYKK